MHKKIVWLTVCILLMLMIGGSALVLFKNLPKHGLLKIDGVDITGENVMIHSNYAELPLTVILNKMGMKVDWVGENVADIAYKDKRYVLSLSDISLVENGQHFNLLLPPPGGSRFYTPLEKELILDSNTIKSTMYQMGIKIDIDINRKEQVVYVCRRNE